MWAAWRRGCFVKEGRRRHPSLRGPHGLLALHLSPFPIMCLGVTRAVSWVHTGGLSRLPTLCPPQGAGGTWCCGTSGAGISLPAWFGPSPGCADALSPCRSSFTRRRLGSLGFVAGLAVAGCDTCLIAVSPHQALCELALLLHGVVKQAPFLLKVGRPLISLPCVGEVRFILYDVNHGNVTWCRCGELCVSVFHGPFPCHWNVS